ncbi:MAG: hybrid sensor histidine kinase/response regulator, partial [Deferrisomatales bacterium]
NDRFCAIVGRTREELLGSPVVDFLSAESRAVQRREQRKPRRGPYLLEWEGADGSRAETLVSPQVLYDEQGAFKTGFAVFTDVTERRRVERALAESEAKYRTLVETTGTGYLIVDGEGRVLDANLEYLRLTGRRSLAEVLGHNVLEWTAPHDVARNAAELAASLARGSVRGLEIDYLGPDGRLTPVEIDATVLGAPGDRRIVTLCRDISGRRAAEAEKAEVSRKLQEAQSLEAVGRLAGGVAHDFNNLLGSILGCLYVAQAAEPGTAGGAAAEHRPIQARCRRGGELTRQLLTVARRRPGQPGPVDLSAQLHELRVLLEHTLPRAIRVRVETEAGLPRVRADRSLLSSALLNLALNARDAMPTGGELRVRAGLEEGGARVAVQLSDTGVGIAPELHRRIFEPFFTTKPVGEGTGLGLSTALAAVRDWGGDITVESAPGRGSTFTVRLAPARAAPALAGIGSAPAGHPLTPLPVLLVEDEPAAARLMLHSLQTLGYSTAHARTGLEALERLSETPYGLVVLDLVLPELSGEQVFRMMAGLAPEVPVLLVSGRDDLDRALPGAAARVPKPFTHGELAAGVARALGAAP